MNAADFVSRWARANLREQQAAQSHFNELCHLLGVQTPTEADPEGKFFTFEEHVTKDGGGAGRADVWYKGRFAWEYKGKQKDLDAAYSQLQTYAGSLNYPPLLVVCDLMEYRIYPQWPNIDRRPWVLHNEDLLTDGGRETLRRVLVDPESFYRERLGEQNQRETITEKLAAKFSELARTLQDQRYGQTVYEPMQVARFLTKLVFAMFAEDIDLLPVINGKKVLEYIFEESLRDAGTFAPTMAEMFAAMAGEKSMFFSKRMPYFNGGLFDLRADDVVIDLTNNEDARNILHQVNLRDWRYVEPSIFGTLFERALDPSKRAQLGAHYTSESDIRLVIEPVLMLPLRRRWAAVLEEAGAHWPGFGSDAPRVQSAAKTKLAGLYESMLAELGAVTVLDPACGSGNFLYVSLLALKDFEYEIHDHFKPLGLPLRDVVTPRQLFGIELNTFAAELAHVVVWIGYLQWRYRREGRNLKALLLADPNTPVIDDRVGDGEPPRILNADAIMRYDADGKPYEPEWPSATVIVGNPPFLGGNKIRSELGDAYVNSLFRLYDGRMPAFADLVCYWFEKARAKIEAGEVSRAGLISTNSIRGGANRVVLERIKQTGDIFMAWADNPWVLDGAAVRVSMVGFDNGSEVDKVFEGMPTVSINPDLTGSVDITNSKVLEQNKKICFRTDEKGGPFDISESLAKVMLESPNPDGRKNSDVIRPYLNGADVTGRWGKIWVIDFGIDVAEIEAQKYQAPYKYVLQTVKPVRETVRNEREKNYWWLHRRPAPDMRKAVGNLSRYLVTPSVSKYRVFVWIDSTTIPDHQLYAFAREDDYFFGVLHSYIHEIWALRMGTSLEDRPRYTPTTTFETFPFPVPPGQEDFSDARVQAIGAAAVQLHSERELWFNPPDLLALGADEKALKDRTLTNAYNAVAAYRGTAEKAVKLVEPARKFAPRLAELHDALDKAVLEMYGWGDLWGRLRMPEGDEELLGRLLAENLKRAGG